MTGAAHGAKQRAMTRACPVALALVLLLAAGAIAPVRAGDGAPHGALVTMKVVVKKGDTLGEIAARHGVKVADLRRWNRARIAKGDVIREGATLIVKVPPDKVDPALVASADPKKGGGIAPKKVVGDAAGKPPPGMWEDQVRVRRGDSLMRLASRLSVPMEDLMAWNRLTERSKLKIGQRLVVYRPGPRPSPQSVGKATAGTLDYGLHLGDGPGYRLRFPNNAWGVEGTLKTLRTCARRVKDAFPGTHDLLIGDLSRPGGGRFPPHEGHQSGRDADVGYYLASNAQNATLHRVKPGEVDYAKTWSLVRCLITTDVVTRLYVDRNIQIAMVEWLRKKKSVDEGQLQRLFEVEGGEEAVIQHARDHDTHLHVRFACDAGQTACVEEDGEEPFDY